MTETAIAPSVRTVIVPRRRWLRRISRALVFGCLGIALIGAGAGTYIWRRSLPELNGNASLPGLQAKVDIYRDANGVPHIFAASRADALRALGYVHASDRFFAMEMNRRAGKGRLAEAVGADLLETDKFLRALDVYRLAEKSFSHFRPETQGLIRAYAEGVNGWLETHRDRLPLEFTLLGIKPEPWQPADSIVWGKLMALRLSANMRDELRRAALLAQQPESVVERLYPPYPDDAPVTLQPRLKSPPSSVPAAASPAALPPIRLAPVSPSSAPGRKHGGYDPALGQVFARLAALWPAQAPGASNEWVVSGARSTTGKPMLANDPHLGLETPVLWYLASLHTPEGRLTGATVPGLPVMLLGQNDRIAWGFTTTNSDVQDIFIETLDPKQPGHYLTPQGSAPFVTRQEIIKVKGAPDVTVTLRATRHGPVISDVDEFAQTVLRDKNHVLALGFTGLGEADTTPEALLDLNIARDWAGFQQALQGFQSPPQNIVYADRDGHIGFTNPALVPVRKLGNGRYPVDGASGAYDWRGMVPFSEVPRLYDPPGGAIYNGNNAVVGPGRYWFGREWDQPWRAQRIEELLGAQEKLALADHVRIQADILSPAARTLLPFMLSAVERDAHKTVQNNERDAAVRALLRNWDFTMRADRPEPLIFEWWLMRLYDALVRDKLDPQDKIVGHTNAAAVSAILQHPEGWCGVVTSDAAGDCSGSVQRAFAQTIQELTQRYGRNPAQWRWGDEHFAPLENRVLGHVPGFGMVFSLRHPSDGGTYTVNRGGNSDQQGKLHPLHKTHGAGYRAVYDLADPARSRFMIATGQSAHPLSPFYGNLVKPWNKGESITIAGTAQEFAAHNQGHLMLSPAP